MRWLSNKDLNFVRFTSANDLSMQKTCSLLFLVGLFPTLSLNAWWDIFNSFDSMVDNQITFPSIISNYQLYKNTECCWVCIINKNQKWWYQVCWTENTSFVHLTAIRKFGMVLHTYGCTGEMAYMPDSYIKSKQAKLSPDTDLANAFDKIGQRNIIWQCSSNLNLFYQIKKNNYVQ